MGTAPLLFDPTAPPLCPLSTRKQPPSRRLFGSLSEHRSPHACFFFNAGAVLCSRRSLQPSELAWTVRAKGSGVARRLRESYKASVSGNGLGVSEGVLITVPLHARLVVQSGQTRRLPGNSSSHLALSKPGAGSPGLSAAMLRLGVHVRAQAPSQQTLADTESASELPSSVLGDGISKLVAAFLHTQCSSIARLDVRVGGAAGDLLRGRVPQAVIVACGACYKGLHLTSLRLSASGIQLQLPQMSILSLRPPPAHAATLDMAVAKKVTAPPSPSSTILQHKFSVAVDAHVSTEHLNASLKSPIFRKTFVNLVQGLSGRQVDLSSVCLSTDRNGFLALLHKGPSTAPRQPMKLRLSVLSSGRHLAVELLDGEHAAVKYVFDLGDGTKLRELRVGEDGVDVSGTFMVYP